MFEHRPNKLPQPGNDVLWMWLGLLGLIVAVLAGWLGAYAAAVLGGVETAGPAEWLLDPGPGGRWSPAATGWLLAFLGTIVLAGWGVWRLVVAARRGRQWTDRLAGVMSTRKDLEELRPETVAEDTERLGSQKAGAGVSLAKSVLTKEWLYATYEWCQVWVMGPRAGKTRGVAVPQVVEHRGAAVVTSNKRDIVYLTRGPRSELGRTWIFDPQQLYREGVTFWWNPLTFVTNMERAETLAQIWLDSAHSGEVSAEDPYFGPAATKLLRNLIMAAAVGEQPVTQVLRWLQFPDGAPGLPDPGDVLREHGFGAAGARLDAVRALIPETRDGVYGGAMKGVEWLEDPRFVAWVTPPEDGSGREFQPTDFVRSTETIYLLSKSGPGSARALVGGMTAALWEAGRDLAEKSGDRVPTPILFELDECANIVRWAELPSLFSYSGSLGLILVVILQSRAQGFRCWGRDGFQQMWSAANIAFGGRGLRDEDHLSDLSKLVGDRQRRDKSLTTSIGHRSTSSSLKEERILSESDWLSMPRGRGVLFVAGTRPILVEVVDLSQRRDAPRIEASKEAFFAPWMGGADEQTDHARTTDEDLYKNVKGVA